LLIGFLGQAVPGQAAPAMPKGLMLNLDFQTVKDGLIPSKALYPLHVPLGDLSLETGNHRKMLGIQYGQGLDIPHSSLLDPDGNEWIVSARIFALTDGIVLSQTNGETGYVIYIKDGAAHASIKTNGTTITLKESRQTGITDCLKNWVTIELRFKPERAILTINRKWVAMAEIEAAYSGTGQQIRLGTHRALPAPMKYIRDATPDGFTGAISSMKIHRQ
jgi:hypothetical protein